MSYIGASPSSTVFLTDQFSGNGATVGFTMSTVPAGSSSLLVSVSGVLQDPSTYSVTGSTLTFSTAPPSGTGNISVRYLGIPASGVTTTAYRTITEFTATAGQTTFTPPSYTVGFIAVYRNGVRLGAADFTATNGTTIVLGAAANLYDLITTESFYVSSVLNAIPSIPGAVNNTYLLDSAVTTSKIAPAAVTADKLDSTTQYTGFKNRVINGAMAIDQRNAGNSLAGAAGNIYGVDRFNTGVFGSGTGRINVQRSNNAPTGFTNSLINTVGTADAAPSTNYGYCVQHKIEGYNVSDLGFGSAGASPVTVTFWVKSSLTGSYVFTLQNEATDQAYSVSYSINASNTWEQKTITFVGSTIGTWPKDNTSGMVLNWGLGGGSVRVASLNSWYAPAGGWTPTTMSGGVNWIGTAGATFQLTGVQLEKGSTATSFDYRPYGTELALCQRYYENVQWLVNGYAAQWTGVEFYGGHCFFLVEKRAAPSISNFTTSGYWVAAGQQAFSAQTSHNFSINYTSTRSFSARSNRPAGNSSPVVGGMYMWENNPTIPVSAEL